MPQNGFSVGRDVVIRVTTADGTPLTLTGITGFHSKPDNTTQRIQMMDGTVRNLRFPAGWSGSMMVERQGNDLDRYIAQQEANYYAGGNELPSSIDETITEPDGSVSQYRYTGVMIQLTDAGDKAGDKTINQSLSFAASRRLEVL